MKPAIADRETAPMDASAKSWTFLTNHARILAAVAYAPDRRIRDTAERTGITERAGQRILRELETDGYLIRTRTGRRTRYIVHPARPLGELPVPAKATCSDCGQRPAVKAPSTG
ncbi:MarR family transcriptional regulator [Actinomadura nitritigenes]|uniref:MarR family transcriptional regulator n=1 Tax=Actinomadura nitritigenes TaxID=134602 RepID=UPI0036783970